jgi:tRNA(Ile)-lysidine synthase
MDALSISTTAELLGRCRFPPAGSEIALGVSGGRDSIALLVLAVASGCQVTAYHVDHGLRPGSDTESDVVRATAKRYGAGFVALQATVATGSNLEARARTARYAVLPPGVATGHTADDQAETVLVNLLRGAGPDGLAGMRAGRTHPILAIRRRETHLLCSTLALPTVEDPSNADPSFLRNRVRHELLPSLCELAGRDLVPLLARQALHFAAESDLLDELALGIDPTDARALAAAPVVLARRAVRRWLRESDPERHPPSTAAVERVLDVAALRSGACETGGGRRVRRSAGRLHVEQSKHRGENLGER